MNEDETKENHEINPKGLILLWAFAESGIGGILHALKLPFTGIFVGGIAVISITLLSFYTRQRNIILKALSIVLLVKLTVSPHSPWQAYIAVFFQGILGYTMFKTTRFFKLKCFVFSTLCMFESAIQKILLTLLIYGLDLIEAIDKAALSLFKSVGLKVDASMVSIVFSIYLITHIFVGLTLGLWIPTIPKKIKDLKINIQNFGMPIYTKTSKNLYKTLTVGFIFLAIILLLIKWLVADINSIQLIFIFIRSVTISLGLIFIVGPIIKMLILRITKNHVADDRQMLKDILENFPRFAGQAAHVFRWAKNEFSGFARIKNFILGLLWLSLQYKDE